jgi:chromosome segregation ATPase
MDKEYKQSNISYSEHWKLHHYFSDATIEGLLEDFEALVNQVDNGEDKNQELSDDVRRLTNQVEELESEVEDLEYENRQRSSEISSLEYEVSSLESEVCSLESQIQS